MKHAFRILCGTGADSSMADGESCSALERQAVSASCPISTNNCSAGCLHRNVRTSLSRRGGRMPCDAIITPGWAQGRELKQDGKRAPSASWFLCTTVFAVSEHVSMHTACCLCNSRTPANKEMKELLPTILYIRRYCFSDTLAEV